MSTETKSFIPPFFKNFGKSTKDLFKKKYDTENVVKVINKSQNGVTIESSGNISQNFKGTVNTKYNNKDFGEIEAEVSTKATAENKLSFKLKKLAPGLTTTVAVTNVDKDNKNAVASRPIVSSDFEYSKEFVAVQAVATVKPDTNKLDVYGSVGFDGFSVGGQVAFNVNKGVENVDANVGAEYAVKDFTVSTWTEKNVDVVNAAYFQRVNKETSVGAQFKYTLSSKARDLIVGTEHQLDFDTVVKAKAELPSGKISTAIEHRLNNPRTQVGVAAVFDSSKPFVAEKFGLSFTFGDF